MEDISAIFSTLLEESGLSGILDGITNIDMGSITEDPAIQSIIAVFSSLIDTLSELLGNLPIG